MPGFYAVILWPRPHRSLRLARRRPRKARRLRRLGDAAALRFADRRTPRRPPFRRHVRRLAHDDHRSRWRRARAAPPLPVANDIAKLTAPGRALYGCLLNDTGGVVDDLIVYRRANGYRAVVNASTRAKVLRWFTDRAENFPNANTDAAPGSHHARRPRPRCRRPLHRRLGTSRTPKTSPPFNILEHGAWMVARTGYTGEDGIEVMLPAAEGIQLWNDLHRRARCPECRSRRARHAPPRSRPQPVRSGHDRPNLPTRIEPRVDRYVGPADRNFVGRAALETIRANVPATKLTGLVMETKGVLRHGYRVITNAGEGEITSGIFSPTWVTVLRSRVCRAPRRAPVRSTSAANKFHAESCVRRSCATAKKFTNANDGER